MLSIETLCNRTCQKVRSSPKWCDIVQGVIEDGFTDNEINMAKEQTLNGFVFNFASTDKQLARACIYALLGIPQVTCPCCSCTDRPVLCLDWKMLSNESVVTKV